MRQHGPSRGSFGLHGPGLAFGEAGGLGLAGGQVEEGVPGWRAVYLGGPAAASSLDRGAAEGKGVLLDVRKCLRSGQSGPILGTPVAWPRPLERSVCVPSRKRADRGAFVRDLSGSLPLQSRRGKPRIAVGCRRRRQKPRSIGWRWRRRLGHGREIGILPQAGIPNENIDGAVDVRELRGVEHGEWNRGHRGPLGTGL